MSDESKREGGRGAGRRSWGGVIQREFLAMAPLLAAGCQPGPVAVEPRPLPVVSAATLPGPPPVVAVADPAGVGPGVGALVEMSERDDSYAYNTFGKTVMSGTGVFSFYTFETDWSHQGMPRCSLKSRTSQCAAFSFAPWDSSEHTATWPAVDGELSTSPDNRLFAVPEDWGRYAPGTDGVYAVRSYGSAEDAPLVIDFVRPDGRVEVFLRDTSARFSDADVAELKEGHVAVLRQLPRQAKDRPYASFGPLVGARIETKEGKRVVGELTPLRIGDTWFGGRASDARDARSVERRAGYGPFRVVPVLDAKGRPTQEALLVWVEAIPPVSRESEEEKRRQEEERRAKEEARKAIRGRKGKQQCGRPDSSEFYERMMLRARAGGGDGCGGRVSRMLSSPDVRKLLHFTRLDDRGRAKGDHTEALPEGYEAERAEFLVVPRAGGGVSVDGRVFDGQLRPIEGAKRPPTPRLPSLAPLRGESPQRILGGAFDPGSGQALILYGQAKLTTYPDLKQHPDVTYGRTFSALGEPLGGAAAIPEYEPVSGESVAVRLGDGWMVMTEAQPPGFRMIGGAHQGAFHPFTSELCEKNPCDRLVEFQALVPSVDGQAEAIFSREKELLRVQVDGKMLLSKVIDTSQRRAFRHFALGSGTVMRLPDGAPALWYVDRTGEVHLESELPERDEMLEEEAELHQVWDDLVVVRQMGPRVRATWLKAKQTVEFAANLLDREESERAQKVRLGTPGPVLPGNRWILPATPGEPLAAPRELTEALRECPVHLPTGPRRLLLGCAEATSEQGPSVRAGVRVGRY